MLPLRSQGPGVPRLGTAAQANHCPSPMLRCVHMPHLLPASMLASKPSAIILQHGNRSGDQVRVRSLGGEGPTPRPWSTPGPQPVSSPRPAGPRQPLQDHEYGAAGRDLFDQFDQWQGEESAGGGQAPGPGGAHADGLSQSPVAAAASHPSSSTSSSTPSESSAASRVAPAFASSASSTIAGGAGSNGNGTSNGSGKGAGAAKSRAAAAAVVEEEEDAGGEVSEEDVHTPLMQPIGSAWEATEHRLRHSPTLGTNFTPWQMLNPFDTTPVVGGEGVQYMLAARNQKDVLTRGYWGITLLATRGRAFPVAPMAVYCLYSLAVVGAIMQGGDSGVMLIDEKTVSGIQNAINMIGVALFFLMGFRTNSSYDRWYEARRQWGVVTSALWTISAMLASRTVRRKAVAHKILRWSVMYAITLKHSMRNEEELDEACDIKMFRVKELAQLRAQHIKQRPLYCCMRVMRAVSEAYTSGATVTGLNDIDRLRFQVERMVETIPAMGRIMNTPMPFAYVVHLRSFMVVWLSAIPFIYTPSLEWGALAVSFFVGYALLGMEAISLEVEKPMERDFNDLPLDDIVDAACSSALDLCKEIDTWPE